MFVICLSFNDTLKHGRRRMNNGMEECIMGKGNSGVCWVGLEKRGGAGPGVV